MMQYQTAIDATKQVYNPAASQKNLQAPAPMKFQSPAATQHGQDVYRGQGQQAAVSLGRNATQAQNQYYLAAQRAQDQSVLGGLANLQQEQANRFGEAQAMDQSRYRMMNDIFGSALRGLM
jgi:hypothetical protein